MTDAQPSTDRDLALLSAYIDQQLPAREREQVQARLKDDRGLRRMLDELRIVRQQLGSAPTLTVPRNFTLTAEQALAIRPPRGFSLFQPAVLNVATAMAALVLVALVAVDALGLRPNLPGPASVAAEADGAAVMLAAEEAEEEAQLIAAEEPTPDAPHATSANPGENAPEVDAVVVAPDVSPTRNLLRFAEIAVVVVIAALLLARFVERRRG